MLERIFDLLMALLLFAFALTRVQELRDAGGRETDLGAGAGGNVVGAAGGLVILVILLSLRHFAEPVRRRLLGALHHLPEKRFRAASSGW